MIGNRLKHYLKAKDLKQKDVIVEAGVLQATLSSVLNKDTDPQVSFVIKLLKAYPDFDGHWLLTGEGEQWRLPQENGYKDMHTQISVTRKGDFEYKTNVEGLKEQLRTQREMIDVQRELIAELRKKEEKV